MTKIKKTKVKDKNIELTYTDDMGRLKTVIVTKDVYDDQFPEVSNIIKVAEALFDFSGNETSTIYMNSARLSQHEKAVEFSKSDEGLEMIDLAGTELRETVAKRRRKRTISKYVSMAVLNLFIVAVIVALIRFVIGQITHEQISIAKSISIFIMCYLVKTIEDIFCNALI